MKVCVKGRAYARSFLLAALCFAGALYWSLGGSHFENPYPAVCDLVATKIYLPDAQMKSWKKLCLKRSRLVKPWSSRRLILRDISNLLETLKISHLEIYEPSQAKMMWRGVNKETGIESEFVDGELVIFKVHPRSPADKAGLRYGDVIESLNGEQPNPWQLRSNSGKIVYRRGSVKKEITLHVGEIQRDEAVQVTKLAAGAYQIRVPSFRREFFNEDPLLPYAQELKKASSLIVDLRGNPGGNFVAGLHFLADFLCEPRDAGSLVKPKEEASGKRAAIPDSLEDLRQLDVLDQVGVMDLKTTRGALCLRAPVRVFVDAKTASVAEMVAQVFKEQRGARLLGSPSSGQLLVGVWYPLDELGKGVQISIPEALYRSPQGHQIEGQGVVLDEVLYYSLPEMQAGEDSWLNAVQNAVKGMAKDAGHNEAKKKRR